MCTGSDNILSIACANLKVFGLSPKCNTTSRTTQRKRATSLILLLVILHISSLYVEMQWCTKSYSFALKVMEALTNCISFVLSVCDFLLPIVMEEELEAFFNNLEPFYNVQKVNCHHKRRWVIFLGQVIVNYVFIASQVILNSYSRLYESGDDYICMLPLLTYYVYIGMGYFREYSMVLLLKHRVENLNLLLKQELFASDFSVKFSASLHERLQNFDKMLDSVELYSKLFGFQVFCLFLVFETTMVQNVILLLNNKDILSLVYGTFLTERSTILVVSMMAGIVMTLMTLIP